MYSRVYEKLKNGGCLGIFPEGGSHDRTDLLPLKAGVSIMALGAMSANPEITVRIVPVGLSYFHPHRFRSRAVVEFGNPIEIPQQLVRDFENGNEDKKQAIGKVMELVYDGLKSVTIQAPDYETLQVIQAARRLYRPPDRHVSLGTVVELNKRFITGYLRYQHEPRVQALKQKTLEYNKSLGYLGLKDHQVDKVNRIWWKSLILLCFRAGLVTGWGILALPGVVLNAPMFICASIVSRRKAKGVCFSWLLFIIKSSSVFSSSPVSCFLARPRGPRSLNRQNCRPGRPRNLEGACIPWPRSTIVSGLCCYCNLYGCQVQRATKVCALDPACHVGGFALDRIFGPQVWRGGHGRVQVGDFRLWCSISAVCQRTLYGCYR